MNLRQRILIASHRSGSGHVPSCFSVLEMLQAVYAVLRKDDIFVLSKGHAQLAYYAVLAEHGFIEMDELDSVGLPGSRLGCHPTRYIPGVAVSTGSLGHGIGVALGMALALRGTGRHVYTLVGDGESNAGRDGESWDVFSNELATAVVDAVMACDAGGGVQ